MKYERLKKIAGQYGSKRAGETERQEFELFLREMQCENKNLQLPEDPKRKDRIYQKIGVRIQKEKKSNPVFRYVAAAVIVFAILSAGFLSDRIFAPNYIVQRTGKGEKRSVTLQDGSVVILNSASFLRYPDEFRYVRNVELQGEAFFKVSRNPQKPFIVTSGDLRTKVLGTSFNINSYSKERASVSVNTGRVEVQYKDQERSKVVLKPNQQVIYDDKKFTIQNSDSHDFSAWTNNTIVLKNKNLQEVARILENWYAVNISIEGEELKQLRVTGKYRDESLENVFKSIQILKNVKIDTLTSKQFIIREKP